ncbi:MAG TPA: type II toxin-antitoxin system VapC family toxin [Rubrivivax sp.]|nr:type II toxin-antitoxin system VapC family toxin [Rubrivivax sp.]
MIAIDTNVLLRLLLRDAPAQATAAQHAIEAAERAGDAVLVNDLVLAEAVWTLSSRYGVDKAGILLTLRSLLDTGALAFENRSTVQEAVDRFEAAAVDFPDALIAAKNLAIGARTTLSFDRAMRQLPGVQWLKTP